MPRFSLQSAVLAFLCASGPSQAQNKMAESTYFPIRVGSVATFRFPGFESEVRCVRVEDVGGVECARFETYVAGRMQSFELIRVTSDGVYRVGFNGAKVDPPMLLLRLPPRREQTWEVDSKLGSARVVGSFKTMPDRMSTAAGVFDAMVVRSENLMTDDGLQKTRMGVGAWYAPKIGLVKQSLTLNGKTAEGELIKYSPGLAETRKPRSETEVQLPPGDYYPTRPGSIALYRFPGGDVEVRCVRLETFAGVECARFETYVANKMQSYEHIRVSEDGVYRMGVNGNVADPPILIFKRPPRPNAEWKLRSHVFGELVEGDCRTSAERVAVAAGQFNALQVRVANLARTASEGNRKTVVDSNQWFAAGVGLVKQSVAVADNVVVGELVKFQPGP